MKKSTRKAQSPKLQVVSKHLASLGSQPLLMANPQAALPLLSMIGQAQLSIEDMLGRMSRQFIEQLLVMTAQSVAGPKHPGRTGVLSCLHREFVETTCYAFKLCIQFESCTSPLTRTK